MSRKIFTATISTIFRSPATWICLCAVLIFFADFVSGEIPKATTNNYHEHLASYASSVLSLSVPIFMSVIVSVDILRDKKNRFLDITNVSGKSQNVYYFSKICAYIIIGFALSFLLIFSFFFIRYFQYDALGGIDYTLPECLGLLLIRWLAYSFPVLLIYISLSVFITLICFSSVAGIVVSTAYAIIHYFIFDFVGDSFINNYIYHIPNKIEYYFYFLNTKAPLEAIIDVKVLEVLLSYSLVMLLSGILFSVGFVVFKHQKD